MMRRKIFFGLIVLCHLNSPAQTIENPLFDRTVRPAFHVDKIELLKDSTCVYCSITAFDDLWANISPQTYIEDVYSKRRFTILRSEGVPFSPQIRDLDKGKKYDLKFIFPALPPTSEIDLIEDPNGQGLNVYGISLTNSFDNVFEVSDYDRISNMADFWASSGDSVKAIDYKKKEIEISKYLYGKKSILHLIGLYNLSDLYGSFGDLNGSVYWTEKATKISMDISRRLIKKQTSQSEKDYYLQAIDIFYGMQGAACKYFMEKKRWKEAKEIISNTYELIKEKNDTSIYIPLAEYFIGCSSYYSKDEDSAEKFYLLSYDSFQKHSEGKTFPAYAELLSMMTLLYQNKGEYNKAYQFACEACDASRIILGDKSKEYGYALTALSNAEMMLNMKEIGLSHAEQASEIIENANDAPYELKELYRERIQLIKNIYNGANNAQSKDTEIYSSDIIPVVITESYNDVYAGNWNVAIEKLYKAKEYQEDNFEKTELYNYVRTVASLSNVLTQSGRLIEANAILDTAIVVFQKNEVKSNLIRHIYASKGLLYYMLNDSDSAILWFNQALDLFRQVDDRSISYALLLANISLLYTNEGLYEDAVNQLDEALDICGDFYANDMENSSDYYTIMNNIALNYAKMGDYKKGKDVYKTIISHATSQNNHRVKTIAMCNLAELYILNEEIQKARTLLEESLTLDVDGYIKEMIDYDYLFCLLLRKESEAIDKIHVFNKNTKDYVTKIFGSFSEREREEFWTKRSSNMILLNNIALSTFGTEKIRQMAYNTALFTKSMLINFGRLLESIVKRSDDKSKRQYAIMQQYKEKLVNKGLSVDTVNSYIQEISQLEKNIVSDIPDFSEKLKTQFKTFVDVKNSLSDNEFAVEFIFVPQVMFPIVESKRLYGALILSKHDNSPTYVPLCSEEALKSILCIEDSTRQYDPNIVYSSINDSLYHLIWDQMEPYIEEGATIYYSPTGLINRINLSAISDGTKRLADKYELYEVSTTANLKEIGRDEKNLSCNAIIYGDVNYDEDIETMERIAQDYQSYSPGLLLAKRSLSRGTWDLLPGTKEEIETISNIIKKKGLSVSVYSMEKANEESFKSLNGKSTDIIHIATHGFYFQDKKSNQTNFFNNLGSYTYADRSMQYSGLLFAGANNTWTGKQLKSGVEDGILTAEEISRIDLNNTSLVVLSACDTGLGDIDNINGVLGLQRGFKRAGVESILMSLWKVDDEATKILMVEFYKNLMDGKSKHQSLKEAQKYLRQVENGKYDKPEYWASFILLDGLN